MTQRRILRVSMRLVIFLCGTGGSLLLSCGSRTGLLVEDAANVDSAGETPIDSGIDVQPPDALTADCGPGNLVYANSTTSLFTLDLTTTHLTTLGTFADESGRAIDDMMDIALNTEGRMFGVSPSLTYEIDYRSRPLLARRLGVTSPVVLNSLAFVPGNLLSPLRLSDQLFGADALGHWWLEDPPGSPPLARGGFGPGLVSSGDLFSGDAGTFAVLSVAGSSDHLATIDPNTGVVTHDLGATGVRELWGLAGIHGRLLGFAHSGSVYELSSTSGAATLFRTDGADGVGWWGAGAPPADMTCP